jgi:hypothetical protein
MSNLFTDAQLDQIRQIVREELAPSPPIAPVPSQPIGPIQMRVFLDRVAVPCRVKISRRAASASA